MKKLILLLLFLPALANATNYYFSATGSDAAAGTSTGAPWQTIAKFNSVFASRSPGDSMLFKRGDTFYGAMIISRSGTSGSPIIIGAYGTGAKPVITGFTAVTAWTSLGSNIYESTSAVTTLTHLNIVLFQDTLQPMGRWPKLSAANGGYLNHQTHSGTTSITSNAIASALSYVGGEVVIRKYPWQLDRGRISAQTSTTVTYWPFPNPDDPTFTWPPIDGHGFFFQNHVNACTVLGEWSYDSTTKKIKMNFGGGVPASYSIKVSTIDTLVDATSADYIHFDNIKFTGANQKGFNFSLTDRTQINNCDIDMMGTDGIWCHSSCTNNQLYNSTISNCNNNGITANNSTYWTITNNTFRNNGMTRGAGISGDGHYNAMSYVGRKGLVQFNVVKKSGYLGIHFQGDSVEVRKNFVDSFCLIKSDGGGIYTYGDTNKIGRRVVSNIITNGIDDIYGLGKDVTILPNQDVAGVYMDGGSSNVVIDSNSISNCGHGIWLGMRSNISVKHNTLHGNRLAQYYGQQDYVTNLSLLNVKHNIMVARDSASLVLGFTLHSSYLSTMGTIDSNYYCRPLYEPQSINVLGYSQGYYNYPDGGIAETYLGSGDYRYRSLDNWKTHSSQDANTVKTYAGITDTSKIRFEYNATASAVDVSLGDFEYKNVAGTAYQYTVNIPAYSSIILLNPTSLPPLGGGSGSGGDGIIIRGRTVLTQ